MNILEQLRAMGYSVESGARTFALSVQSRKLVTHCTVDGAIQSIQFSVAKGRLKAKPIISDARPAFMVRRVTTSSFAPATEQQSA
jgi:hypothetical protein